METGTRKPKRGREEGKAAGPGRGRVPVHLVFRESLSQPSAVTGNRGLLCGQQVAPRVPATGWSSGRLTFFTSAASTGRWPHLSSEASQPPLCLGLALRMQREGEHDGKEMETGDTSPW